MKIYRFFYLTFSILLLVSCAHDNVSDDNGGKENYKGVTASVSPKVFSGGSRSSLSFDAQKGMVFSWKAGDQLTILPESSNIMYAVYTIQSGQGTPTAHFTGDDGFSLTKSARYYAINQRERTTPGLIKTPDKGNVTLDYSGQRQVVSGTSEEATAHLGAYDFLVSTGVCDAKVEDQVHFAFKHLGFTMYIKMAGLPKGKKYRKLEIYDSKNVYRKTERTIDLANGFDGKDDATYAPFFNSEDVQSEEYKSAPRFSLLLGPDTGNDNDNSNDEGIAVGDDGELKLFVELPPVDMRDNTFIFTLVPSDGGTPYYMTCDDNLFKREYQAGNAYMLYGSAQPVNKFNVRLRVNHDWQLGNAVSRATGDPGIEDKFAKPKFIYSVFCVGGNVKEDNGAYFKKIATPNAADWKTSDDKVFDTYQTYNETTSKYEDAVLEFSVLDGEKDKTKNVYFVASMEELDGVFNSTNIKSTTTEAQIQSLLYSIPSQDTENSETGAAYQVRSQSFLKNLYSTPWESQSTFVGALKDPYQDVILYHVAAKVDLKWNSTAMLSGNVSVNNVKSTNLSLFKPTANASATNANYTVTNAIDEETMFNGRQVFYLPQFNAYNVTVGSATENVTFSPATTNGWTSWLRWLAKF